MYQKARGKHRNQSKKDRNFDGKTRIGTWPNKVLQRNEERADQSFHTRRPLKDLQN